MTAKELAVMLIQHPEAGVDVRVEKEQILSDQTTGFETLIGDLLKEALIWTGEKYVIATDLCDFESEG